MGERLAETAQQEITTLTGMRDCRAHARTGDLLRLTRMPVVKIDFGYATNLSDSQLLADATQRDVVSSAVALAVSRVLAVRIG
jgi:N-acetylmuramoyl-L-alanine amidase